jgi:hypothetical protein
MKLNVVKHICTITHPAIPLAANDCDAENGVKAPRGTGVTTGCGTLKSISDNIQRQNSIKVLAQTEGEK